MMRYLTLFDNYITEVVNNPVNVRYVLTAIKDLIGKKYKIESFDIRNGLMNILFSSHDEYNLYFNDKALLNKIKTKFNNPHRTITFNNYVSGYNKVEIMIKDLYLKRVKPPQFVYHVADKSNYSSIKKNGLIAGANVQEYGHYYGYDKPFVFATINSNRLFMNNTDLDVWIIDTTMIDNKWYEDFNYADKKNHIITDKDIPSSALKRVTMQMFDKKYR